MSYYSKFGSPLQVSYPLVVGFYGLLMITASSGLSNRSKLQAVEIFCLPPHLFLRAANFIKFKRYHLNMRQKDVLK